MIPPNNIYFATEKNLSFKYWFYFGHLPLFNIHKLLKLSLWRRLHEFKFNYIIKCVQIKSRTPLKSKYKKHLSTWYLHQSTVQISHNWNYSWLYSELIDLFLLIKTGAATSRYFFVFNLNILYNSPVWLSNR